MKKLIYDMSRNSGKTDLGIHEFMKDPENNFFIVHNKKMKNIIIKDRIEPQYENWNNKYEKNIVIQNQLNIIFREGRDIFINSLIIDDWGILENLNKLLIYNKVNSRRFKEISTLYIFGTGLVNNDIKVLIDFIKTNKNKYDYEEMISMFSDKYKFLIRDLYYSFLTDKDSILIEKHKYKNNFNELDHPNYDEPFLVSFESIFNSKNKL